MIHEMLRRWSRFWFEFDNPMGLALMRIQISLVLLWMYVHRQFDNMQDYGAASMIPRDLAIQALPQVLRPPFAWFFWPDSWAPFVHVLFLILIVMMLLGVATRAGSLMIWILHMGFLQRNYAIVFGADVISAVLLFYFVWTRHNDRLSLCSWWCKSRRAVGSNDLGSVFARLLQIQLAAIYAYTGFEKLRGYSWWDGTALWTVLGNPQMVAFNLDFVRAFPMLIAIVTFLTIVFEIYWPFAVMVPSVRKWWLFAGVAFHSGIGLLMSLWTFSLVMLSPYWLFVDHGVLESKWAAIRKRLSKPGNATSI